MNKNDIKEFEEIKDVKNGGCDGCDINIEMIAAIKVFIDSLIERKKEEWTEKTTMKEDSIGKDEYYGYWDICEKCGCSQVQGGNYCRNCGRQVIQPKE